MDNHFLFLANSGVLGYNDGKIDTTPLITHRYKLEDIEEAYHLFENKLDGVIKVAVEP